MINIKFVIIYFSIAVIALLTIHNRADAEKLNNLRGPSFTDPSQTMEMPEKWREAVIKYEPSAGDADLVVNLDQQMYPAFLPLIKKYAEQNGIKIVTQNGSCGISAGMLTRKAVDIGGFCCPPGLTDRLPGLTFHTLGIAAIAIIVHPDNPVESVTIDDIRKIFMGELYRWSEISNISSIKEMNVPVQPVGRLHCKLRAGHWRLILDNEDLFNPGITEVGAIPDMISQVTSNVRAIGYETLWMTTRFQDKGSVKILKINGYDPLKSSAVLSGNYPFYRVYNLTTWNGRGIENKYAEGLINYLLKQVNGLDAKYGLIPVSDLKNAGWFFQGDELVGEPGYELKNEHRTK